MTSSPDFSSAHHAEVVGTNGKNFPRMGTRIPMANPLKIKGLRREISAWGSIRFNPHFPIPTLPAR